MNLRLLPKHLIGQIIRGIRGRLRLSQASLAEQLGVEGGEEAVRRWETGEEQPDRGVLTRLATLGLVDVLVFHQQDDDTEHLPPGEAAELQGILLRMEALMVEAREVVERAARRSQPGVRAPSASLEVAAEVRPRKTAKKASARKSTRAPRAKKSSAE